MNKIAIIGLGYVGLPLARLFATQYPVVGFDINQKRIEELKTHMQKKEILENLFYERESGSKTCFLFFKVKQS